ncbi:MAG: DUF1893 domain-containing protein [Clostridiaceae bacterium]
MNDLNLAKHLLDNENLTLAIVKDGNAIFTSYEKGIKPLYTIVNEMSGLLKNSSVADKVTGKAAALLYKHAGIKELYTNIISEKAVSVLKSTPIVLQYNLSVPYIKNRDKSGMCPVESMSSEIDCINDLMDGISDFLDRIRR